MIIPERLLNAIHLAENNLKSEELANQFHVDPNVPKDLADARKELWKEPSGRQYVIDPILTGLGWKIQSSKGGNVESEVGVESEKNTRDNIRSKRISMDYLGFERTVEFPLLIVEAKRINISLPNSPEHRGNPNAHPTNELFRSYLSIRNKPASTKLSDAKARLGKEWVGFLDKHVDYIRSTYNAVQTVPRRSVITNGEWIVLFPEPADFLSDSPAGEMEILTFENFASLKSYKEDLHRYLAFEEVCKFPPTIAESEILDFIAPANVEDLAHGVSLKYNVSGGNYRKKPNVLVAPILFLKAKNGRVVAVLSSDSESECSFGSGVSFDYKEFQKHSEALRSTVEKTLGKKIAVKSVAEILVSCSLPPVWNTHSDLNRKDFLLVTGDQTFFMRSIKSHEGCAGHSRKGCGENWALSADLPSVEPEKSMFCDGNSEFCGHKTLKLVRLGARPDNAPVFHPENPRRCHLVAFEQYACCRSCSLLEVCEPTDGFKLVCEETGLI